MITSPDPKTLLGNARFFESFPLGLGSAVSNLQLSPSLAPESVVSPSSTASCVCTPSPPGRLLGALRGAAACGQERPSHEGAPPSGSNDRHDLSVHSGIHLSILALYSRVACRCCVLVCPCSPTQCAGGCVAFSLPF